MHSNGRSSEPLSIIHAPEQQHNSITTPTTNAAASVPVINKFSKAKVHHHSSHNYLADLNYNSGLGNTTALHNNSNYWNRSNSIFSTAEYQQKVNISIIFYFKINYPCMYDIIIYQKGGLLFKSQIINHIRTIFILKKDNMNATT